MAGSPPAAPLSSASRARPTTEAGLITGSSPLLRMSTRSMLNAARKIEARGLAGLSRCDDAGVLYVLGSRKRPNAFVRAVSGEPPALTGPGVGGRGTPSPPVTSASAACAASAASR